MPLKIFLVLCFSSTETGGLCENKFGDTQKFLGDFQNCGGSWVHWLRRGKYMGGVAVF